MIPKQDRIQARTPAQLEQEYNFGKAFKDTDASASKQATQIQNLTQSLVQFMALTQQRFTALEGNIQTWFSKGVPTLVNYPAVEWETDEDKAKHIGDIYYNEDDGSIYLFKGFEWVECQGKAEETETYYVAFYSADGVVIASYLIRQGDAINPPVDDANWKDGNGAVVSFPYTPTSDTDLTIFYQLVRSEIELHNASDVWYSHSTTGDKRKGSDGWAIVGYAETVNSSNQPRYTFYIVAETIDSLLNTYGNRATVDYNGQTYHFNYTQFERTRVANFGKCVQIPFNTSNEQTVKDLLDYYYMVE